MLKLILMWIRYNKCQSYIAVQFFSVVYLEIEQQGRCSLSASLSVYGYTLVYLHKDFCDFVSFICLNGTSSSVVYLYFQVLKCLYYTKKKRSDEFLKILYVHINSKNYIHWEHNKNVCKKNLSERYRLLPLSAYSTFFKEKWIILISLCTYHCGNIIILRTVKTWEALVSLTPCSKVNSFTGKCL